MSPGWRERRELIRRHYKRFGRRPFLIGRSRTVWVRTGPLNKTGHFTLASPHTVKVNLIIFGRYTERLCRSSPGLPSMKSGTQGLTLGHFSGVRWKLSVHFSHHLEITTLGDSKTWTNILSCLDQIRLTMYKIFRESSILFGRTFQGVTEVDL